MNVGIIGLGKMGYAVASRIHEAGHVVVGYDLEESTRVQAHAHGIIVATTIEKLAEQVDIIWLMLPAGNVIDDVLDTLKGRLKHQVIIDGGNSNYEDSIRRAHTCAAGGIKFLDCGTSGGLQGAEDGFSLMLGGDAAAYGYVVPVLKAVACKQGYALVGPSGAGHYVKAVHNGIEYGLLQAYAEGFQILKEGHFKDVPLDLAQISDVWMHGSIIRSHLLHLAHDILRKDQDLKLYKGYVAQGGTGLWAAQEAHEHNVPVPVLDASLQVRVDSSVTGGNFATKLIALLRHAFGGHAVESVGKK